MQTIDEKLQLGSLIKIKDKFKKAFMRKLKMSKDIVMAPFRVLGRPEFGIVTVRSEENHKTYQLSEDDLKPAYWLNYKNDLKAA